MKDPEIFGTEVGSVKSGVEIATSYLQMWGVPYVSEIREVASLNDKSGQSCEDRHKTCEDISLKDSYTKSVEKVQSELYKPTTSRPAAASQQPKASQQEEKEE